MPLPQVGDLLARYAQFCSDLGNAPQTQGFVNS